MTMTERLLEATKEIWADYNEKPFVKGIADGSLDHKKFKYYMIQDYLYLLDYTKVFSLGTAKAADLSTMGLFSGYTHSILDEEMQIHRTYMKELGITKEELLQTPLALDNLSYTSYMLRIAYEGGAPEVMAAILSCALSYEWIAKKIVAEYPDADKHPFYGEWIRGYASDSYHKDNEVLIRLMDHLAEELSEEGKKHLTEIFVACSRYEAAFWDMAWEMRS